MRTLRFDLLSPQASELSDLIKLAIGSPTPEKVEKILGSYDEPDHHLFGSYDGEKLVGMIGLQVDANHGVIKHIAVLDSYRNQEIGKTLITEALKRFHLNSLEAETDEEGRGFYEKCNFKCSPFAGKYNMRYRCKWKKG